MKAALPWLAAVAIALLLAATPVLTGEGYDDLAAEQATADSVADAQRQAQADAKAQRVAKASP